MSNKYNDDRRHHIPKMSFKVQNWPDYEAGLRRRGSLTLWFDDAVLDRWQSDQPDATLSVQNGSATNRRVDGFCTDTD
jgi:hypothetical protein